LSHRVPPRADDEPQPLSYAIKSNCPAGPDGEHRDAFTASPAKYAPAYGGWCSAGASKGKKVATKPEFWKIVDGQLYLNSSEVAHTKLFLGDTAGVIRKGEMNWKTIYATQADKR
jgi:hypothetical protein